MRINNFFSFLVKNDVQLRSSLPVENCKGNYENNCGLPSPEIQNIFSLNFLYRISSFDASSSLSVRYIDSVKDTNSINPVNFGSYNYLDMNFSIDLVRDINFSFGMNNILDKNPPLNGLSLIHI